jgi:hypothetical protein
MKKLLLALLCLLAYSAQAQKAARLGYSRLPVDSVTHLVTYSAVVPVEGATKEELYLRAKEWLARSIVDSKAASRMDDKEAGTLVYYGTIKNASTSALSDNGGTYGLVFAVYTKDGRYKYVIDQFTYSYRVPAGARYIDSKAEAVEKWANYGKMNARYVDTRSIEMEGHVKALASSLAAAMAGRPTAGGAKGDW